MGIRHTRTSTAHTWLETRHHTRLADMRPVWARYTWHHLRRQTLSRRLTRIWGAYMLAVLHSRKKARMRLLVSHHLD